MNNKALSVLITHLFINPLLILFIIVLFDKIAVYYLTMSFSITILILVIVNIFVLLNRLKIIVDYKQVYIKSFVLSWLFLFLTAIEIHYILNYYHNIKLAWVFNSQTLVFGGVIVPVISSVIAFFLENRG